MKMIDFLIDFTDSFFVFLMYNTCKYFIFKQAGY